MIQITEDLEQVSLAIKAGGVVICPTEGVYGLSCDPTCDDAVRRVLALKKRAQSKGLILVGESLEQISPYVNWATVTLQDQVLLKLHWPGPVTFILPMSSLCSDLVCGEHHSAALRVTAFSPMREMCHQVGGPLISTSANISGQPSVSEFDELNQELLSQVDVALCLPCGGLREPTAIYDTLKQKLLRPSSTFNSPVI